MRSEVLQLSSVRSASSLFLRTTEIFDIIVDFPDSMPALLDLKVSSENFHIRHYFIPDTRNASNESINAANSYLHFEACKFIFSAVTAPLC